MTGQPRNPAGRLADRPDAGPPRFYVVDEPRSDLYVYGKSDPRLRPADPWNPSPGRPGRRRKNPAPDADGGAS